MTTAIARGIDISGHNLISNWTALKRDNIKFVIIKASEGRRTVSKVFRDYWQNAKINGYLCGTYHFARPYNDPEDEAAFYVKQLKSVGWLPRVNLPPCLDIEHAEGLSKSALTTWCLKFLSSVDTSFGLKEPWLKCGVYCNTDFYNNYLDGLRLHEGRWLWHASWLKNRKEWPKSSIGMSYRSDIWQFTNGIQVPGAGLVDGNIAKISDLKRHAPLYFTGDEMPLSEDDVKRVANAVLNTPLIDMSSVAERYQYSLDPPIYSLRQIASDTSWRSRAIQEAFRMFAASLDEETYEAVNRALEDGMIDVDITVRDKTDTESSPQ